MSYTIRLIDTYGEKTELDVNNGGLSVIMQSLPAFAKISKAYGFKHTNDGDSVPLYALEDSMEIINKQADELIGEDGVWVRQWLRKLQTLIKEAHSEALKQKYPDEYFQRKAIAFF